MIELRRDGKYAEIVIQHEKPLNPFTLAMTRELISVSDEVEADDRIVGALLWGGAGRSFSVGGDFEDLRTLETEEAVKEHLRDIVRSYQAVLRISKPVVVAVDRHAIGQGMQVALMGDWRLCTDRSLYHMPELAHGVPCPLGSVILETLLGRSAMLQLVIGCGKLDPETVLGYRLAEEICASTELESVARERLEKFCGFPQVAYRLTKKIQNQRFIDALETVREPAAAAHAVSFLGGQADEHFAKILNDGG